MTKYSLYLEYINSVNLSFKKTIFLFFLKRIIYKIRFRNICLDCYLE